MHIEDVTVVIQLILAPLALTSTCALMLIALLPRYGGIDDQLRMLLRHFVDITNDSAEQVRLIENQVVELTRRHKLMHDAILMIYVAILTLIIDMFVIALAVVTDLVWVASLSLMVFLAGAASVLIGICHVVWQLLVSHRTLRSDAQHVLQYRTQ